MVEKLATAEELESLGVLDVRSNDRVVYFDKKGGITDEHNAVSKVSIITDEVDKLKRKLVFHIKYRRGELFDPYGMDSRKGNALDTKYKKVDEEVFNAYTNYLKTRRNVFFVAAKREFIKKGY